MAFVSWAVEYQRAKDALANRSWDAYFLSSIENSQQMRTTYTILGNVQDFMEWLHSKAIEESAVSQGATEGGLTMCIGGY
jgi:hypothetical protein